MTPSSREITPWLSTGALYGEEFRQGANYANWRPAGSGDFLLIFTVAGSGQITWPEGMWETRPGDAILYEPHAYQDYRTNPGSRRWHLLWAHFTIDARWAPWLEWPRTAPGLRNVHLPEGRSRADFAAALRQTGILSRRTGQHFHDLALNALERTLILALHSGAFQHPRADPRIQKSLELIAQSSHLAITVETLASHCGLSQSRFAHLFRAEVGVSPVVFLESERLRRAANLLRLTKLPVAEIAEKIGYESAFYFSARFKKKYHRSPLAFRRAGGGPT